LAGPTTKDSAAEGRSISSFGNLRLPNEELRRL
jgi:hypothetical protein